MHLTDDERALLDGRGGKAKQKAMELLVRYGEALGLSTEAKHKLYELNARRVYPRLDAALTRSGR